MLPNLKSFPKQLSIFNRITSPAERWNLVLQLLGWLSHGSPRKKAPRSAGPLYRSCTGGSAVLAVVRVCRPRSDDQSEVALLREDHRAWIVIDRPRPTATRAVEADLSVSGFDATERVRAQSILEDDWRQGEVGISCLWMVRHRASCRNLHSPRTPPSCQMAWASRAHRNSLRAWSSPRPSSRPETSIPPTGQRPCLSLRCRHRGRSALRRHLLGLPSAGARAYPLRRHTMTRTG